jgi:hypothetical protein
MINYNIFLEKYSNIQWMSGEILTGGISHPMGYSSWELNHSRGPGVSHGDYFAW